MITSALTIKTAVGNATASGQHYKPELEEAMKATTHNTPTMNTILALGTLVQLPTHEQVMCLKR